MFMRLLAPPTPSTTNPGGATSISTGRQLLGLASCALCHTPVMQMAHFQINPDLSSVNASLFSDLLVPNMGATLADGVTQGGAGPDDAAPARFIDLLVTQ